MTQIISKKGSSRVSPKKLGICSVLGRLENYVKAEKFEMTDLRDFQRKASRVLIRGGNIFLVVRTGGGKTLIAFVCLFLALMRGQIGVYLVPHNQLLSQKVQQIQQFFGDEAHVIYLSGEGKPPPTELRKNQGKLIIVATYEAFRNFLFQVQNREYFSARQCFGAVVVDEVHMLQDSTRGVALETMLYKLKTEYNPQFCFLSGTFNEASATWWSTRLGCLPIYYDPARTFKFREVKRTASQKTTQAVVNEKIEKVLQLIEEFIEAHQDESYLPSKLISGKMLIFCYSRNSAEKVAEAIIKRWGIGTEIYCDYIHAGLAREEQRKIFEEFKQPDGIRILCSSPLLETGIDVPEIETIIVTDPENFDAIRLAQMCGRTREEEGEVIFLIHWNDREAILSKIIFNPQDNHKIIGFKLEDVESQISKGRIDLSEKYRLTLETLFRHQLSKSQLAKKLHKYNLTETADQESQEEINSLEQIFETFLEFYLNQEQTRYMKKGEEARLLQSITEALRNPQTKKTSRERVGTINLKEILSYCQDNMLIRRSGGRYSLTHIGAAVVESGLQVEDASRVIRLFVIEEIGMVFLALGEKLRGEHDPSKAEAKRKLFSLHCRNLIANLMTKKAFPDPRLYIENINAVWLIGKWRAIWYFLRNYNIQKPTETELNRQKYGISEGDAEKFRRTAIWIASSLHTLYGAFKLHQWTLETTPSQYYSLPPRSFFDQNQTVLLRLQRIIERFQGKKLNRPEKPWTRRHPVHITESRYSDLIEDILKTQKQRGATIKEIQDLLKKKRKKLLEKGKKDQLEEFKGLSLHPSSISATLNQTLKGKTTKALKYTGAAHRTPARYWLKRYKPQRSQRHYCQECAFFARKKVYKVMKTNEKTHCKNGKVEQVCNSGLQDACPEIQQKTKPLLLIHDFETLDGELRCPQCGRYGTIQPPTAQKLTICNKCRVLLWQVRLGRYAGKLNVQIPPHRIRTENGYLSVELETKKRTIFLKEGETLRVRGAKKTGIPLVSIAGRGGYTYFLDEVLQIILAGGQIGIGRDILERHRIPIIQFADAQIAAAKQKEVKAEELRSAISSLPEDRLLKKACEFTIAKILSNIYYTLKIEKIIPANPHSRETGEELAFRQYDYLARCLAILRERTDFESFTSSHSDTVPLSVEKALNKLRSQEGNAEIAAWDAVKQALPKDFQFEGRQLHRYVRSALARGVKALDPFNSALNYLYYLLAEQVSEALGAAGFSKYYPGPGLLHRRQRSRIVPSKAEHKEHHELLYDFMDSYRAPFRFHLLRAFQQSESQKYIEPEFSPSLAEWREKNHVNELDFESSYDDWHRRIYTLNNQGTSKMNQLFKLICTQRFSYKNEERTLQEIISIEAKDFAKFLLQKDASHIPFRASDETALKDQINHYFNNIKEIMEYLEPNTPPSLARPPPPEPIVSQILFHSSIRHTIDGKTFRPLIFRDFFDYRKIKAFLQAQTPHLPDFIMCLSVNHSLNFQVFNEGSVNLSGLLKYLGIETHSQKGLIYPPQKKLYQAGSIALFSYRPTDELIEWISNSHLTGNLADLYPEEIIEIPRGRKIEPKDWFWVRFEGPLEIHQPFDETKSSTKQTIQEKEFNIIFQHGEILPFPLGNITLLFSEWKDYKKLFTFLHYFILSYQSTKQKSSPAVPASILYIDTIKRTLNFKQFISLSAPLQNLKSIIFTQIADFSHLESFIQEYFRDLIQKAQIELIILNLPFDLIDTHYETNSYQENLHQDREKVGLHFIKALKMIAMHTNIPILLTALGTSFNRASVRTVPTIPDRVKSIIRNKIFLKQPRTNFQLEIRKIEGELESIESYIILRLSEKRKDELSLVDFTNISKEKPLL